MPLYEYSCRDCSHAFEALVYDGESPECPHCRGRNLERRWSVPARPRSAESLPMRCNSEGPPCGPACSRWQQ